MNIQKVSQYFFIIAAVVAILDGAFSLSTSMKAIKIIVLILSGIIVGVLKHTQEKDFLVSGVAVVITGYVLVQLLGDIVFAKGIGLMLMNFIIFLSSALVVVGIHQVGGSLTFPELLVQHKHKQVTKKVLPAKPTKKELKNLTHKDIERMTFEKVWGTLILVAVAFTFIILLAELFFEIGPYQPFFQTLDIIITVLFIADLIVLYDKSKGFKDFLRNNFFDIIAAVPTIGVLRALKIIRAIRVIRALRGSLHITKIVKMYKTSKFFSEESYFNHLDKKAHHKHK